MARKSTCWKLRAMIALFMMVITLASCARDIAFKPQHPTHKVVCRCSCEPPAGQPEPVGEVKTQTYDVPLSGCGSLNGVSCTTSYNRGGELKNCQRDTVSTTLVIQEDFEIDPRIPTPRP